MKFTVHMMPPPRLRPLATTRAHGHSRPFQAIAPAHPDKPLKTLSFPVDSKLTFQQLWKVTEQRFREACDKDKLAGMYFSHLEDLEGGTIFMTDTIGSLYPENGPATERMLFMYMQDVGHVEREGTFTAASSDLRPKDFRKRRWSDLDEAEQANVKRRRREQERYGTTIDELDPDTPVMSREAENGDITPELGAASPQVRASSRVDADGFKIPARPHKGVRKPKSSAAQSSPVVLVHSSQDLPTPESADIHSDENTPNRTPSSAQRPPESPETEEVIASSKGSQSAFRGLGKTSGGPSSQNSGQQSSTKKVTWSPAQDDILRQGYKEKWSSKRISQVLGGRSEGAVRARKKLLEGKGELSLHSESVVSQGSQTSKLDSSPPTPSQSSAARSSPCETAAHARDQPPQTEPARKPKQRSSQARPVAWVQPCTSKPMRKLQPSVPTPVVGCKPTPAREPVTEAAVERIIESPTKPENESIIQQPSHGQTATPPESVPSETSAGKLRAPRGGLSAAARLRESRSRVKSTFNETNARNGNVTISIPELHKAAQMSGVTKVARVEDAMPQVLEANEDAPEVLNGPRRHARKVNTIHKEASLSDAREAARASELPGVPGARDPRSVAGRREAPKDEPVLQRAEVPGNAEVHQVEINHQSLNQAVPEVTLPQHKNNSIYKNRTDKQRWKVALELAKGDKIRAKHIFVIEINKEDMVDAVASDDKQEIERLKAQRRRRERELATAKGLPSPKRRVPTSFSGAPVPVMTHADVDEEVIREDDWSTDEEEGLKKSREDDYEYDDENDDENDDALCSDTEEFADMDVGLDGPRIEEVTDTPPPVVTQRTDSSAREVWLPGKARTPLPVKERTPPLVKETLLVGKEAPELYAPAPSLKTDGGSKMRKTQPATLASKTSEISDSKQKKNRRRSRTSDATSSRRDSSVLAAPSDPMAAPTTRPAFMPTLVNPPKRRLTREKAVAAHLAECKRKENLYLRDDDDDDDESSVASST